tara:strand:- start:155 stop:538 length:384 start_codon:yes stop_codon:yes gene_type:complete
MNSIIILLEFLQALNVSLQVGDSVYFNSLNPSGGFLENSNAPKHFGTVENIISPTAIEVRCPYVDTTTFLPLAGALPTNNDYISFSKNRTVNNNSLKGYYGSVNFQNNSKVKAELFSVGSEVSESSK